MDPRNSAALIIFHCVCVCNRSVLHKTAPQAHTGSGNPGNPTLRYLAKLNDRHLKKTFSFLQVVFFFFFFSAPDKRLPLDNGFVYTELFLWRSKVGLNQSTAVEKKRPLEWWHHRYIMNTHLKLDSVLDERYSGHARGLVPIDESSHKAATYSVIFYWRVFTHVFHCPGDVRSWPQLKSKGQSGTQGEELRATTRDAPATLSQ